MSLEVRLVDRLSRIVGSEQILTDPAHLDEVSWDALSDGRIHPLRRPGTTAPLCVVLPASTAEVREVVLLANEEKVPIVPYGGGSGLMGGALSVQPGIVVDLRKMDKILEIDGEAQRARVQAGVVLETLEKGLNEKGLILGHDPWTLPVATVGGAVSTNSLGYRGGKYGSMGDQLLGLEAVLPNGEILRTRSVPKSSTGISLKHLFIGGEGCFGVITEAAVRVFPLPEERSLSSFRFASFEQGFAAVQKIFARGLKPALVDFGDDAARLHGGAILYLAFEGTKEIVEAEERLTLAICGEGEGRRLPQGEAESFWRERHVIANRFMHSRRSRRERSSDALRRDWIHVALPASEILAFRKAAMEIVARRGVCLQESGLWTRPELFSMRLAIEDGDVERAQLVLEDTVDELLRLVQKMGGSMEYCHGVGVKLASLMAEEHGYGLEVMRQIKRALDPNNIMNPGKLGL
ncbi:MAG: FAD-binding oxidoreductase [Candidatus Binatia bacterium]